jgi:ATP-binding cassette subfamily B protein
MSRSQSPLKLQKFLWEAKRLSEAIECLGRNSGYLARTAEVPSVPNEIQEVGDKGLEEWFYFAANKSGIEILPVETTYSRLDEMLGKFSPGIMQIGKSESCPQGKFLICLKSKKDHITILTPSLKKEKLPISLVHDVICYDWESKIEKPVENLLNDIGVASVRKNRVKQTIFNEQLGNLHIAGIWMLRMNPGVNPVKRMFVERIPHKLAGMITANIFVSILGLASWTVIGMGAFHGEFEWVWLTAWALLLITMIPFRLMANWFSSLLSIQMGVIFKERLLYGVLKLKPEQTKTEGVGQFMGRVMESEAVKQMAMGGGLMVFYSLTQLLVAMGILMVSGAGILLALFAVWFFVSIIVGWRYFILRRDFTIQYRVMTNDLIERMVGHRTRLAQEDKNHWHDEEDQILSRYLSIGEKLDMAGTIFQSLIPRGWLLLGLGGFTYSYIINPEGVITLGMMLGAIMITSKAYSSLVEGMFSFIELFIAWKQFEPIFKAGKMAQDTDTGGSFAAGDYIKADNKPLNKTYIRPIKQPDVATQNGPVSEEESLLAEQPTLMIRDLTFRYREFGKAVIESGSFDINPGDRILIKGPSGGGKSTLASILACIRHPQNGLILFNGVDRETIGSDEWRKQVVMVPQFHENFILTESFAFNLLMGRQWPPTAQDYKDAKTICEELGLGELLKRMPSGFQQMVGESGWRLSHGEKSRVYIARALLQKSEVLILDESFAALDPVSLKQAMDCVLKRVKSLIVIAHP